MRNFFHNHDFYDKILIFQKNIRNKILFFTVLMINDVEMLINL